LNSGTRVAILGGHGCLPARTEILWAPLPRRSRADASDIHHQDEVATEEV